MINFIYLDILKQKNFLNYRGNMLSVIIPAHKEIYLQKTIDDILSKAKGEIEIIVCLDGYWPDPQLIDDKRVKLIHSGSKKGMRYSINSAARVAKGKYLMKCDAHCMFADGFDEVLKNDCQSDWTMVPVRYSLDINKWDRKIDKKYEFEFISSDDLKGKRWGGYAERVVGQPLPALMTFQGSCWFMYKDRFFELGGLDEENYGGMGREAQEICLKSWLSGGRCVLDRNTWYAHWSKSKKDIRFSNRKDKQKSVDFATKFWFSNKWDKQVRDINWLVGHFAPVPTWDEIKTEKEKPMVEITQKDVEEAELKAVSAYRSAESRKKYNWIEIIPGMDRAKLYQMFAENGFKVGAEVGVQRGRNAFVMLNNIPSLELLYLVEPYRDHTGNRRSWGKKLHQKFKKQAHSRFDNVEQYKDRVKWIEEFSDVGAYQVPDRSLDFVYIDGEHTWDFVMLDLIIWSKKVKKGGIISGHDFEYRGNGYSKRTRKVAKALEQFIEIYHIPKVYLTDKTAIENPGDRCPSFFFKRTFDLIGD